MGKLDSSVDPYRGEMHIFIGESPLAFATTATMEVSTEELDISNKMLGSWTASSPGRKSFTASSEALITHKTGEMSFDTLLAAQIAGTLLDFTFSAASAADQDQFGGTFTKDTTHPSYSGKVMITSLTMKSDNGQIATCSVSLKGIGGLVPIAAVPAG